MKPQDVLDVRIQPDVKFSGGTEIVWGLSPAMHALRRVVSDIASTDIPILIIGESGTGKGFLALHIHGLSNRRGEPFIKTNCRSLTQGNLPRHVQDSTKADGHANRNELATFSRGTILWDNICELDEAGQRSLLDLLPDETALSEANRSGARVISTARRELEKDLRTGNFIRELYFRLSGISLCLPPLRQRKQDIPDLTDFFINKHSTLFERQPPKLSDEVLARLGEYPWPGNIRQLENTVRTIVATGDVNAALDDLVEIAPEAPKAYPLSAVSFKAAARDASRQVERELLLRALTKTHWNRKRAAQELEISYKSLLSKLKQMAFEQP